MNPDVVAAVAKLESDATLSAEQAQKFARVARRELVSVQPELRAMLYVGVLVIISGVGFLVKENLNRIGPLAVASALWFSALLSFVFALRKIPAFTWGKAETPHLAFEYLLLLAVLLTGAALTYSAMQVATEGSIWLHPLFLTSLLAAFFSVRGDSRLVWTVALSTFAAWQGLSTSKVITHLFDRESTLRASAVLTAIVFLGLGQMMKHFGRKEHFEPLTTYLGWLAALFALTTGVAEPWPSGFLFGLGLLALGSAISFGALHARRLTLFATAVFAAYIGLTVLASNLFLGGVLGLAWFAASGIGILYLLRWAHRRMKVET
jgi:hypothetical protein